MNNRPKAGASTMSTTARRHGRVDQDTAAALRRAASLERAGLFVRARVAYQGLLRRRPDLLPAFEGLSRTSLALGDRAGHVTSLRALLDAHPHAHPARRRLALLLLEVGPLDAAEEQARLLADAMPGDASVWNLLGVILKRRGFLPAAVEIFRRATEVDPSNDAAWYNLGNTLLAAGSPDAVAALAQATSLRPTDSETFRLYGQALSASGRPTEALAIFDQALALDPGNAHAHAHRAVTLHRCGHPDDVVFQTIDRAITVEPNNTTHLRTKAQMLGERSYFAEAESLYRTVLDRSLDDVETLLCLGQMLGFSLKRYEEANALLDRAVLLRPTDPRCLSILCKSLLDSRYGDEAAHLDRAGTLARQLLACGTDLLPHAATLSSTFLRLGDFEGLAALGDRRRLMSYWVERMNVGALHSQLGQVTTPQDRRELVEAHRAWGRQIEAAVARQSLRQPAPQTGPRNKIRVGFLSSDLRNHPVSYFALPLFEHSDRSNFELFCYSFYPGDADPVASFIAQKVAAFRPLAQVPNREVAQRITDDRLDILFELGGSTRFNRVELMAYKAAPVQVSWLGYPHSAGLESIDRILVDPWVKPADPALLIEQPFQMPESWVCLGRLGFREEPIEPGLPSDRREVVTFGTMNNPYKYSPALFALWADVLRRVPGSRFLFVRPECGAASFRANVTRLFDSHGVAPQRIEFERVRGAHLRHYNRIDVALDTAPHTGGTTTCETLWMGVPVVTLVGEAFFERLSSSNLNNAGLGDLCAASTEEYVDIAVSLAADVSRRRELRQNLRGNIRGGPLGDTVRWVRHFETEIERVLAGNS
jgi:predicted O-linked N-acetylglucosamine transferase (SPINDLY family)